MNEFDSTVSNGVEDSRRLTMDIPRRTMLGSHPTPIQFLSRLSERLGTRIYCKRDDLTTFGFGGNKLRKLEYLLGDARPRDADCLVTCGSNQSNWCRMTSVAGAVLGLDVHLVLAGREPARHTGNLLLASLAGARISHLDTDDDAVLESASVALEQTLRQSGRRPHRIPLGGSTPLGALGYVDAMDEIAEFQTAANVRFSSIVFATGSAGTQAGLVAGAYRRGWSGEVLGVAVSRDAESQRQKVRMVLADMVSGSRLDALPILVEDRFFGAGYRARTTECAQAIELFARCEGIFLDEVYTGKAAAALIEHCRQRRWSTDEAVLFLHTGGVPQLFE